MIILNRDMPKGCFECDCKMTDHFDGNELHYFCPYLQAESGDYKEVSDDGERDPECPIVSELTEKEYRFILTQRKIQAHEERKKQWRKEHGIPEPKPNNFDTDFGVPVYLED